MAQKKITDLTLRSAVVAACNFAVDDGTQTYRVTAAQIYEYLWPLFNGVRTISAAGSDLVAGDRIVLLNPTSASFSQNLPACADFPVGVYKFKNIALPSNGNTVTLDPSGSELIDDQTTIVLNSSPSMDGVDLYNTGLKWLIV